MLKKDPVLHTHVEDLLDDEHPLAGKCVFCSVCNEMLHCSNNECMQTWIESGLGNYCLKCFTELPDSSALDDEHGLPDA